MTEYESELTGLEFVANVLQSIKLLVWGDLAVHYLGVPVVHGCYMLGVADDEMEQAASKLADVGFIRQPWSFGSTIDPATRKDDEVFQCYNGFGPRIM
ncbi:f3fc5d57-26a0-415a-b892-1cd48685cee8 [Sclerotinia trifoliorum]|uniref:F3fc5d57-26a0-415a-b892-1cd48685cee8 n=1 Tax=Sclerotinia trifoliorum TaxID=28548 RepID=A0A8H2VYR8_9HELO|nr:f3fc5d57-26a0-415a-b892-1cd48685cee8 [Sclerotinia trifoliorum]